MRRHAPTLFCVSDIIFPGNLTRRTPPPSKTELIRNVARGQAIKSSLESKKVKFPQWIHTKCISAQCRYSNGHSSPDSCFNFYHCTQETSAINILGGPPTEGILHPKNSFGSNNIFWEKWRGIMAKGGQSISAVKVTWEAQKIRPRISRVSATRCLERQHREL